MMKAVESHLRFLIFALCWFCACSMSGFDAWLNDERDSGEDGTVDGYPDGDADIDWDADVFADGDGDAEEFDDTLVPIIGMCLDGTNQVGEGLTDCESSECLASPGCCVDVVRQWVEGDFSDCSTVTGCGWEVFPTDMSLSEIDNGWVVLHSTTEHEIGFYSEPNIVIQGETMISFAMHLEADTCRGTSCRHALGAALTLQDRISSGTGVNPAAGIVLDGERQSIHFVINGRIETSIYHESLDALMNPTGYAMSVRADGSLAFWQGLIIDESGEHPEVVVEGEPSYQTLSPVAENGARLRLAFFGSFRDEGRGRIGTVNVERPVCDVPDGFSRTPELAVHQHPGLTSRYGRPSIVRMPRSPETLLMVHEYDSGLAVATSEDGIHWTEAQRILTGNGPTEYGRVARRAPSVLYAGPDSDIQGYHLWFEAESEYSLGVADQPRFAIVHALSTDGLNWVEEEFGDSIALIGEPLVPWRAEVRQPSVVTLEDGSFLMFFIGMHPETGMLSIGNAYSVDGKTWRMSDEPIELVVGELGFERDGISHPTAVVRGSTIHLWYAGYSGARATIGYAVGSRLDAQNWSWQGLGPVFEAWAPWEARRVLAPAVVLLPLENASVSSKTGMLHMWYEAGPVGIERIGLTSREIPIRYTGTPIH